jgi:hypothetical protein
LAFELELLQGIAADDLDTFNVILERLLGKARLLGAPDS